jgi:hypothetical protein
VGEIVDLSVREIRPSVLSLVTRLARELHRKHPVECAVHKMDTRSARSLQVSVDEVGVVSHSGYRGDAVKGDDERTRFIRVDGPGNAK